MRTSPYPDIVEWWSEVNDAIKLTAWEIDDLLEKLNHIKQKNNKSCMEYLMTFQEKANEYINIGNSLSEEEQERKSLKGFQISLKAVFFSLCCLKISPATSNTSENYAFLPMSMEDTRQNQEVKKS